MGMIIPIMGTPRRAKRGIGNALFTPVQQRVLGLLFGQSGRRFQSAELIRLVHGGSGAAQRILKRLADAGLVDVTRIGNQKHYQANRRSPVYHDLQRLVVKTSGAAEPLARALRPLKGRIAAAFVYGSVASGSESAASDVDVLVVGDGIEYADLFRAFAKAERTLARKVNPNIMTAAEWREKHATPGTFAARIAKRPRIWLIGSDDDLA